MTNRMPTWEYGPLRDGAAYGTFGQSQERVLLLGGGFFDVYTDGYADYPDYLRCSDMFVRQPEPQQPRFELLESVIVDAQAVRDTRATTGEPLDDLADQPPFRRVADGVTCWYVQLQSGHDMWVMAHRWKRDSSRLTFEVQTVGGREPSVLDVVAITPRSVLSIELCPLEGLLHG